MSDVVRRSHTLRICKVPSVLAGKVATAEVFLEWPEGQPWIYLHGQPGTGKTHRAAQFLAGYLVSTKGAPNGSRFLDWPLALDDAKRAIGEDREDPLRPLHSVSGVVVLDDLGSERPSDFAIDTANLLISHRYNEALPTILTSNLGLREIAARYGERISSRILELAFVEKLDEKNWRAE